MRRWLCSRFIFKKKTFDVDICTNATPKELKEIFKDVMLPKLNMVQ